MVINNIHQINNFQVVTYCLSMLHRWIELRYNEIPVNTIETLQQFYFESIWENPLFDTSSSSPYLGTVMFTCVLLAFHSHPTTKSIFHIICNNWPHERTANFCIKTQKYYEVHEYELKMDPSILLPTFQDGSQAALVNVILAYYQSQNQSNFAATCVSYLALFALLRWINFAVLDSQPVFPIMLRDLFTNPSLANYVKSLLDAISERGKEDLIPFIEHFGLFNYIQQNIGHPFAKTYLSSFAMIAKKVPSLRPIILDLALIPDNFIFNNIAQALIKIKRKVPDLIQAVNNNCIQCLNNSFSTAGDYQILYNNVFRVLFFQTAPNFYQSTIMNLPPLQNPPSNFLCAGWLINAMQSRGLISNEMLLHFYQFLNINSISPQYAVYVKSVGASCNRRGDPANKANVFSHLLSVFSHPAINGTMEQEELAQEILYFAKFSKKCLSTISPIEILKLPMLDDIINTAIILSKDMDPAIRNAVYEIIIQKKPEILIQNYREVNFAECGAIQEHLFQYLQQKVSTNGFDPSDVSAILELCEIPGLSLLPDLHAFVPKNLEVLYSFASTHPDAPIEFVMSLLQLALELHETGALLPICKSHSSHLSNALAQFIAAHFSSFPAELQQAAISLVYLSCEFADYQVIEFTNVIDLLTEFIFPENIEEVSNSCLLSLSSIIQHGGFEQEQTFIAFTKFHIAIFKAVGSTDFFYQNNQLPFTEEYLNALSNHQELCFYGKQKHTFRNRRHK